MHLPPASCRTGSFRPCRPVERRSQPKRLRLDTRISARPRNPTRCTTHVRSIARLPPLAARLPAPSRSISLLRSPRLSLPYKLEHSPISWPQILAIYATVRIPPQPRMSPESSIHFPRFKPVPDARFAYAPANPKHSRGPHTTAPRAPAPLQSSPAHNPVPARPCRSPQTFCAATSSRLPPESAARAPPAANTTRRRTRQLTLPHVVALSA